MTITISDLTEYPQFLNVQQLHRQIWGLPEGGGLYPPMLNTVAKNGGSVLGAFDGDRMVGFLFGFLGLEPGGGLKWCSQTMGVVPDYRGRGIGAALKWAQRDRALALGIEHITWTFDPLEAPNACLNLHKLGGTSQTYLVNLYGDRFTALGSGLPSDRLVVDWWIASPRVVALSKGVPPTPKTFPLDRGSTAPGNLLEIPPDIQAIKKTDLSQALNWRLKTRAAFQAYFEQGYITVDVLTRGTGKERRLFYVLKSSSGEADDVAS